MASTGLDSVVASDCSNCRAFCALCLSLTAVGRSKRPSLGRALGCSASNWGSLRGSLLFEFFLCAPNCSAHCGEKLMMVLVRKKRVQAALSRWKQRAEAAFSVCGLSKEPRSNCCFQMEPTSAILRRCCGGTSKMPGLERVCFCRHWDP